MTNTTNGLIALIIGIAGAAAVVKVLHDANKQKRFVCPTCGHVLRKGTPKCPSCGTVLRWSNSIQ